MIRDLPQSNEIWRHFKNKDYLILDIAIHTETKDKYVVYKQLYPPYQLYIRPLDMFMSEVDKVKYPTVAQKYRFEKVTMYE